MNLEEFYRSMQGSYFEVLGRLGGAERVTKYIRRFTEMTDYQELEKAVEEGDIETAFRAVHNLKGMSGNLGFTRLFHASDALCENLRPRIWNEQAQVLMERVKVEYQTVIRKIANLEFDES